MDVVGLARHGIDFSVATLGTATTQDHLNRLFPLTEDVYFAFDGDAAGRKAAWRALENALPQIREGRQVRFVFLPEKQDPDSFVQHEGASAFETLAGRRYAALGVPDRRTGQDVDLARSTVARGWRNAPGRCCDGFRRVSIASCWWTVWPTRRSLGRQA